MARRLGISQADVEPARGRYSEHYYADSRAIVPGTTNVKPAICSHLVGCDCEGVGGPR